jgi:hypothetical protein
MLEPSAQATSTASQDAAYSPSSGQPKKAGPSYSHTWYRTPLDNAELAKDHDGIIATRQDLRVIRARVEYGIKKLSKFAGDGGSENGMLKDDEINPFCKPASEVSDIATDDVDSVDVGTLDLGSNVSRPGASRSGTPQPDVSLSGFFHARNSRLKASNGAGSSSAASIPVASSSEAASSGNGDAEDIDSSRDHGALTCSSDIGYTAASSVAGSDDVDKKGRDFCQLVLFNMLFAGDVIVFGQ